MCKRVIFCKSKDASYLDKDVSCQTKSLLFTTRKDMYMRVQIRCLPEQRRLVSDQCPPLGSGYSQHPSQCLCVKSTNEHNGLLTCLFQRLSFSRRTRGYWTNRPMVRFRWAWKRTASKSTLSSKEVATCMINAIDIHKPRRKPSWTQHLICSRLEQKKHEGSNFITASCWGYFPPLVYGDMTNYKCHSRVCLLDFWIQDDCWLKSLGIHRPSLLHQFFIFTLSLVSSCESFGLDMWTS